MDPVANAGRDYELLGDLHTRQGKTAEAVDAYSKAVQAAKTMTITILPGGTDDGKAMVERAKQRIKDLSTKLARTLLDAGRVDEARKALEVETMIKVDVSGSTRAAPVPLPAKLTISATKKLLDQVGTGKMSYEDFRKQATIDYNTFAETAPPPVESKKK